MSTIKNVTMSLLDQNGQVVPTTTTTAAITAGGTSFPLGDFSATVSFTQIVLGPWVQPNKFYEGSFNGPVATTPGGWSNATIDASSNLTGFTADRIAVAGDTIRFDMQGLVVTTTTRLVINVAAQ
jgi:hypothetical protein